MSRTQPTLRRLTATVAMTGLLAFGAVAIPASAGAAGGGASGQTTSTTLPSSSSGGSVKAACSKSWWQIWKCR